MYYTQEQIDRANQADLVSFLQSQGEQLTRAGNEYRWKRHDSLTVRGNMILSRLVDTFISRISLTMLPVPNPHNTVCVLSWEEARHWQSRSSGYSSS